MTSDCNFKIDGVSSNNFDLWVDTLPIFPMQSQNANEYYTDSDEGGVIGDDVFQNAVYTISAYKFNPTSYNDTATRKFFADGNKLELSCYPNMYFKILNISAASQINYDGRRIDYAVRFALKPFKYATSNEFVDVSNGGIITYDGNRYGKPCLGIDCYGDVSITINDSTFKLVDIPEKNDETSNYTTVTIDTDRTIVFIDDKIQVGNYEGVFPTLLEGENSISWSGEVDSVKVKKNTRWY